MFRLANRYDSKNYTNYDYWKDGLTYLREIEMQMAAPTLFDLLDLQKQEAI